MFDVYQDRMGPETPDRGQRETVRHHDGAASAGPAASPRPRLQPQEDKCVHVRCVIVGLGDGHGFLETQRMADPDHSIRRGHCGRVG